MSMNALVAVDSAIAGDSNEGEHKVRPYGGMAVVGNSNEGEHKVRPYGGMAVVGHSNEGEHKANAQPPLPCNL